MTGVGLLLLGSTAATGQSYADERQLCADKSGGHSVATRIAACTAAIDANQETGSGLGWFYAQRGLLKDESGDANGALADYSEAIRLNPTLPTVFVARGTLYAQRANGAAALSDFNEAIHLDPQNWAAHFSRALLEASTSLPAAIDDFTAALRAKPDFALAYLGRASAEDKLGRADEAKADYARALEFDPDVVAHWKQKSGQ
jgi:tetratricopeptide (TPR) repeat protein